MIATSPVVDATHAPAFDANLAQRIDRALQSALDERRIVGSVVLVARKGRLIHARAAGLADREAQTPMRQNTVFRLASVTKPIVTVALMRLVEHNVLRLDDPVTRWLPDFTPRLADGSTPTITLAQLLAHTSGLGYRFQDVEGGDYEREGVSDGLDHADIDLDENLRRLARVPLHFEPGSAWRYSLGVDVLGAVIERATGGSLADAIAEWVTAPLGMTDTAFVANDPARLAAAYANGESAPVRMSDGMRVPLPEFIGGAIRFAPSRALDAAAYPSGGAGMVGTAGDVLRLLEVIRGGGDAWLSENSVAQMATALVGAEAETQGPGWGFGYGGAVLVDPVLAETPQSRGTLQWGGVYGHAWFVDPACGLSVVALTNTAYEGMIGQFTFDVRNAVYGV